MRAVSFVTRSHVVTVVVAVALILTLVAGCGQDSTGNEALPGESPTVPVATRVPGDTDSLLYFIENPVLECRDGVAWVSIQQLGYRLGDDTVMMASPIKPDADGYRRLDTALTSSQKAFDVFPDRDYIDETTMTATVEAKLPAHVTDSDQQQFVVLLSGTYDETGEWFSSNSLVLETSAARC